MLPLHVSSPAPNFSEFGFRPLDDHIAATTIDSPCLTINRKPIALIDYGVDKVHVVASVIDDESCAADYAGLAHLACD